MNTISKLSQFIIMAFSLLLSAQALAENSASLIRANKTTLTINYYDYLITQHINTPQRVKIIGSNGKYYAGSATEWVQRNVTWTQANGNINWTESALAEMDKDKVRSATITVSADVYNSNDGGNFTTLSTNTISLDYDHPIALLNTAFDIEEGAGKYAVLDPNQFDVTFAIVREGNSHLFEIVNDNQIKFRNVPDYETIAQKTYQLKIKMTKPSRTEVIEDITINLKNIADTDPSDITFTVPDTSYIEKRADGIYYIKENIPVNTLIGSVTIVNADPLPESYDYQYQEVGSTNYSLKPGNKFWVSKSLDYESKTTNYETINIYNNDLLHRRLLISKRFNYQVVNVNEKTINIADQVRSVAENADIGASVGAVITTTGDTTITGYSIESGNDDGIFSIDTSGQIIINDNSKLDYEDTQTYSIGVKVSGDDADDKTATITINIDNISENIIVINDQQMEVLKASDIGVVVGTVVLSSGTVNAWSIVNGTDSSYYQIDNNGVISVAAKLADSVTTHSITVQADGEDANPTTATITIKVTANAHPPKISNTDVTIDEGTIQVLTITASDADSVAEGQVLNYEIAGTDVGAFILNNQVVSFREAPDYESKDSYSLVLKVSDGVSETQKNITVTINNIHEKTIEIETQTRMIDENSVLGTDVGDKLITKGIVESFSIVGGNSANLFRIDSSGQIKVSNTGLDYEGTKTYALTVKITGADADDKTAVININVANVNEKIIAIVNNQSRSIVENSIINTPVGDKIATIGTVTGFEITQGDTNGIFTVDNTGQIKVAKSEVDYETLNTYSLKVKITGEDADEKMAIITVRIDNVLENTIGLNANQVFYVPQGQSGGSTVSTVKTSATINAVKQFTILNGNDDGFFFVTSSGLIVLLKDAPATVQDYILQIEIKADDAPSVIGAIEIKVSNDKPAVSITSSAALTADEGAANTDYTLAASDADAIFSIVAGTNTGNLFTLSGTTLSFNGSGIDFESTAQPKTYTVKVKATTDNFGTDADQNAEQTITVNIQDINDETPTDISLSGDRTIGEGGIFIGAAIGTLTTIDADASNAFTYTVDNDDFLVNSNNFLTIKNALDYETTPSITLKITVADGAGHTFEKEFTITVTDFDDTAPTNIQLTNTNLVKDQPAGTIVGTLSANDVDTDDDTLSFSVPTNDN
ncbi:MAG: hypothetical protein DSY43_01715, partial [Gammaproteobacteria bacterium]